MSLIDKPNLLSVIILGVVVLIAGGYGVVTYTSAPDLEHFPVDTEYNFPFNFDRPQVVKLPKELKEISGLAGWKEDGQLLGVQDEDGLFYIIDAFSGDILDKFEFGKDRDYEGIDRDGDEIFVLERDGDIHRFTYAPGTKKYDAEKIETDFTYRNDTEGVGHDPLTGTLLIVPKEDELFVDADNNYRRGVYSFDLDTRSMAAQPTYFIDQFEVGQVVYGKDRPYMMKPSGVAVDPVTKDIYVIASVGNILVVIDRNSEIKHIEILREKIFRQPEGICFDTAGNLYISSEGRSGKGAVARLVRQPTAGQKNTENEQGR